MLVGLTLLLGLIAWIPLYGILFPPLVDLPEHILISKLLWEKFTGVSHLDLEISWILGYRLFPAFMMIVFPWCKLWGISFVFLPRLVAMALIGIHVIAIATLFFSQLKERSWRSGTLAACFVLPAIVCMYSACWFIGFVNYTLAITLLLAARGSHGTVSRLGPAGRRLLDLFRPWFWLCRAPVWAGLLGHVVRQPRRSLAS